MRDFYEKDEMRRLRMVEHALAAVMYQLEPAVLNRVRFEKSSGVSKAFVNDWWNKRRADDIQEAELQHARYLAKEERGRVHREQQQLINSTMAKLTPDELAALKKYL